VAFCTVFQAFLTSFLIDSGYKTPIQNMDEQFTSGIKLAHPTECNFIVEKCDETEAPKLQRDILNCLSYVDFTNSVMYQKNVSNLLLD